MDNYFAIIYNKIKCLVFVLMIYFSLLSSSCKKETKESITQEMGLVTDVEGNVYKTVKIGDKWWMAENLKVKKYRNGVSIPQAQLDSQWKDTTDAYCIYDNNPSAPGLLYNWYVVNDTSNIAPIGWHVPTDDEWKNLEKYLGMSDAEANKVNWRGSNEADKLKMESPNGWTRYGTIWSTNESGFTALAGGCRIFNGVWGNPGLFSTAFWWSSTTDISGKQAYYRYLDYKKSNVFRFYGPKTYGFSIRCVRD